MNTEEIKKKVATQKAYMIKLWSGKEAKEMLKTKAYR